MRKLSFILLVLVCIVLSSCITLEDNYAPVTEISVIEVLPKSGVHRVLPDETLYSIAWRYGLNYSDIAKLNNISPPYAISAGQLIYLTKHKPRERPPAAPRLATPPKEVAKPVTPPPAAATVVKSSPSIEREPTSAVSLWKWPAKGPIVGTFSASNKGINIAGQRGDPIYATAAGKVVYSGNGLRGYGNLIIIKHNSIFLTAYAHNSVALVKGGDWVNSGQQIAEMGSTGAQRVMLHFEIRRNGNPVNPLIYLGRRK